MKEYGLEYFHAVECAHSKGSFASINKISQPRLYSQLVGIIRARVSIGVIASFKTSDYLAVRPGREVRGAYEMGMWLCFTLASAVAQLLPASEKLSWFFEKGGEGYRGADAEPAKLMSRNSDTCEFSRYTGHGFKGKRELAGLQAADLLAYEILQEQKRTAGIKKKKWPRIAFTELMKHPHVWAEWDMGVLKATLHDAHYGGVSEKNCTPRFRQFPDPAATAM